MTAHLSLHKTPHPSQRPSRKNRNFTKRFFFGFQAQEQDEELWEGSVSFKYRVEDPRLGRFFSVDPLFAKYAFNSPFCFSENSLVAFAELEGKEKYYSCMGEYLGSVGSSPEIRVMNESFNSQTAKTSILKANSNDKIGELQAHQHSEMLKSNSTELFEFLEPINDVLNDAPLETWSEHGDCKKACDEQLNKAGYSSEGPNSAIQTEVKDGNQAKLGEENRLGALIYIGHTLKSGMPIILGVKDVFPEAGIPADVGNENELTGHFVVAVGMSMEGGNIKLRVYDNATSEHGKDKERKLTFDYKSMLFQKVNEKGYGMSVTEVRKTNKKKIMKIAVCALLILSNLHVWAQDLGFINQSFSDCIDSLGPCECRKSKILAITLNFTKAEVVLYRNMETESAEILEKNESDNEMTMKVHYGHLSLSKDSTELLFRSNEGRTYNFVRIRGSTPSNPDLAWTHYMFLQLKSSKFKPVYEHFADGTGNWNLKCACLHSKCLNLIYNSLDPEKKWELSIANGKVEVYNLHWISNYESDQLVRDSTPLLSFDL